MNPSKILLNRRHVLQAALAASLVPAPAYAEPLSGRLLSRTAYKFPFATYAEWLAFMDKSPNPDWQASQMRTLISEATFTRYARQETVRADSISYRSDGLAINGFALFPRETSAPPPVILYAHGGVAKWGRITFFDMLELFRLAERGYAVIASALRGEGGSEGKPNLGIGDREDMLNLIPLASELGEVDSQRIGLWGFSRGGGLGYRVLAATDKIRSAVLVGASADLVTNPRRAEFDEHVYRGIVDNYLNDPDGALRSLSAAYWPEKIAPEAEILLIHGAADDRVQVTNSLTMAGHLSRLNRRYELLIPERGSHTLIEHQNRVRSAIDRWFDRSLGLTRP